MSDEKRRLIDAFNLVSEAYDESPARFFDLNAAGLIREAQIPAGARVLGVATGTGKVALAAGPSGRVVGIGLSNGMLSQARRKIGILPVMFAQMDAEARAFNDKSF